MADPFRIRPARSADAPALAALERRTFSDAWPASAFTALGPGEHAFVAEATDGGGVLGFVVARVAADEGEILDLAVGEGTRRRGIGTALLRRALDRLAAAGVRRAFLEVRASNGAAQAFYRRHGFRATGTRAAYYRKPPEDAVIMTRPVSPVTDDA